MIGYHVTTPAKLSRYRQIQAILPPVRFWPSAGTALKWARRTGRTCIVKIRVTTAYPLPDHKPAYWTGEIVRLRTEEPDPAAPSGG